MIEVRWVSMIDRRDHCPSLLLIPTTENFERMSKETFNQAITTFMRRFDILVEGKHLTRVFLLHPRHQQLIAHSSVVPFAAKKGNGADAIMDPVSISGFC